MRQPLCLWRSSESSARTSESILYPACTCISKTPRCSCSLCSPRKQAIWWRRVVSTSGAAGDVHGAGGPAGESAGATAGIQAAHETALGNGLTNDVGAAVMAAPGDLHASAAIVPVLPVAPTVTLHVPMHDGDDSAALLGVAGAAGMIATEGE